jgi:hypothetical protein
MTTTILARPAGGLYPAIRTLLKHEDSIARYSTAKTFSRLTDDDLVELLPDIARSIETSTATSTLVNLKDFKSRAHAGK